MIGAFVYGAVLLTGDALACGGTSGDDDCPSPPAPQATVGGPSDPAKCARTTDLVGVENCAWTTGMMAQRVLADGVPWTFVGRLVPSDNDLPSKVAAPYTVGPAGTIHVVANEVLEALEQRGATTARLELTGKLLEVEGIKYLVITEG
jgi:hypothetical protein